MLDDHSREAPEAATSTPDALLRRVVADVERHVADAGWDQPTRLFALAPGESIDPGDVEVRGMSPWVALEQSGLPPHDDPLELLARVEWPVDVVGAVVVFESVLVSGSLPDDPVAARQAAARDPRRHEARLVAAALREGAAATALRWRGHDSADDVSFADGRLVPAVTAALRGTFVAITG